MKQMQSRNTKFFLKNCKDKSVNILFMYLQKQITFFQNAKFELLNDRILENNKTETLNIMGIPADGPWSVGSPCSSSSATAENIFSELS